LLRCLWSLSWQCELLLLLLRVVAACLLLRKVRRLLRVRLCQLLKQRRSDTLGLRWLRWLRWLCGRLLGSILSRRWLLLYSWWWRRCGL
jgi:hypothetical protein